MICPNCGSNQNDNAAVCSNCGYKFRFGHAFNDPSKMMFLQTRGGAVKIIFIIFCIAMLGFVIWISIKSI